MSLPAKDNVLYRFARGPFDDFDDTDSTGSTGSGSVGIGIGMIDEILGRLGLLRRHGWIVDGLGVNDIVWFADEYDMNIVVPNGKNVVGEDRRGIFASLPSRGVSFVSATFAPSWEWAMNEASVVGTKNVVMVIRIENRDEAVRLIRTAKDAGYVFVGHIIPRDTKPTTSASTSVMVFVDTPSAKTLSIRGVHTVNPEKLLKF